MKLPLISPSSPSDSTDTSAALLQNFYIEYPTAGKSKVILRPTPGTNDATAVSPNSGSGCRGSIAINNNAYHVFGDSVFKGSTIKASGLLTTTSGAVFMAASGDSTNYQILITDGANAYVYSVTNDIAWKLDGTSTTNLSGTNTSDTANKLNDSTAPFTTGASSVPPLGMTVHSKTDDTWAFVTAVNSTTQITLSADIFNDGTDTYEIAASYGGGDTAAVAAVTPFTNAKTCEFMDGFFLVDDQATDTAGRFYKSAPYDATRWSALDFATAERHYDKISCIKALNRQLWLIGTHTTEIWYNSGNPDFPFIPMQQGFLQIGVTEASTVSQVGDSLCWVANHFRGGYTVERTQGLRTVPISTPEIAEYLHTPQRTDLYATSYINGSHTFYVLTFQATINVVQKTVVYDFSTNTWHNWAKSDGGYFPIRTAVTGTTPAIVTFGDADLNNIYSLIFPDVFGTDPEHITQAIGTDINRTMITRILHGEGKTIVYRAVELDLDETYFFPMVTTGGSGTFFHGFDVSDVINPTVNTDKVQNLTTGEDAVTVTGESGRIVTAAGTWAVGDRVFYTDGTDGSALYPIVTVGMRYRDEGGAWSTRQTRSITALNTRCVWRMLGQSKSREFKFDLVGILPTVVLDAYAIIETQGREF